MAYFNIGEIYVSGVNRLKSGDSSQRLKDDWLQIIKIKEIDGKLIYLDVIATHPSSELKTDKTYNTMYETPANIEFFKKITDPELLKATRDIIITVFNKD